MSREDRIQQMLRLFRARKSLSMAELMNALEVERATVKRYFTRLKDTVGVPVKYDHTTRRYRVETQSVDAVSGLEGLWFSAAELHALLTMEQLLQRIEPGILRSQIEPIRGRLQKILGDKAHSLTEIEKRVRVLPMSARPVDAQIFQACLTALLNRKRLSISYMSRTDGVVSKRNVSPQRLVHYRDNWYLDAWCHQKRSLRMFSVDAIPAAKVASEMARDMPEDYLKAVLESGYGIFSGRRTRTARLRFSAQQARWMSTETWHPKQQSSWDKQGRYLLRFPYSSHPELIMDLLRHVPGVEVLGPKSLRKHLNDRIRRAAEAIT
jgi:predicted DNA-binding transcriptional regulator YafY